MIHNQSRGLKFVPIDLDSAKLFVFVDGSFANNKDLSSQIGRVIILANEVDTGEDTFEVKVKGNIIHCSSTKIERVARSFLERCSLTILHKLLG
jgi:hypothetical protein